MGQTGGFFMPENQYDLRTDPSTIQSGAENSIFFEFSCKKGRGDLTSASISHPESYFVEKSWNFTPTTVAK